MTDLILHLIPNNRVLANATPHTAVPHIVLAPVRLRRISCLRIFIFSLRLIRIVPPTELRAARRLFGERFEVVSVPSAAASGMVDVGIIVAEFHVEALQEALQGD